MQDQEEVRSEESGAFSRSPEAFANKPPRRHFDYGGCSAVESVKAPASQVLTTIPGGRAPSLQTEGCVIRTTKNGGWNQSELYSTTSSACSVEVELLSRRKSTVVTPYTPQGQAAKLPCVIYRGEIVSKRLAAARSRFPELKGTNRGMPLDVAGEKDRKELESARLVAPDSVRTPTTRYEKLPRAPHPAFNTKVRVSRR